LTFDIKDRDGREYYRKGDSVYYADKNGNEHYAGAAWDINSENHRVQYVLNQGEYEIALSAVSQQSSWTNERLQVAFLDHGYYQKIVSYDTINGANATLKLSDDKAVALTTADGLEVTPQLDQNDYTRRNFDHVDKILSDAALAALGSEELMCIVTDGSGELSIRSSNGALISLEMYNGYKKIDTADFEGIVAPTTAKGKMYIVKKNLIDSVSISDFAEDTVLMVQTFAQGRYTSILDYDIEKIQEKQKQSGKNSNTILDIPVDPDINSVKKSYTPSELKSVNREMN